MKNREIDQEISKKFKIIFLIIHWKGWEKINRCLSSLKEHLSELNYQILVVDNHSEDGSSELIRQKFPEAWLLINPENLGFARAVNRGMEYLRERQCAFDYLCLLNNDVEFRDNSWLQLIKYLDEEKEVAACTSALLDRQGRPQSGVAGFNLTLRTAFNHFFWLSALFPKTFKGLYIYQNYFYRKKMVVEVDWLSGAALIIRHRALDLSGPMPEYFFMYAEDLAYGEQLKKFGSLIYYPGARAYHLQDERKPSSHQCKWLDSIFAWFILKGEGRDKLTKRSLPLPIRRQLNLLILKLIFLAGFFWRWIGYFLWSLGVEKREAKLRSKEMKFYFGYILKNFLITTITPS